MKYVILYLPGFAHFLTRRALASGASGAGVRGVVGHQSAAHGAVTQGQGGVAGGVNSNASGTISGNVSGGQDEGVSHKVREGDEEHRCHKVRKQAVLMYLTPIRTWLLAVLLEQVTFGRLCTERLRDLEEAFCYLKGKRIGLFKVLHPPPPSPPPEKYEYIALVTNGQTAVIVCLSGVKMKRLQYTFQEKRVLRLS